MKKADVFWNTASAIIAAIQPSLILIFISRMMGIKDAGIFTFAYAFGNLAASVGKYGVRNYQATDLKEENTFLDYCVVRAATVCGALLLVLAYLLIQYQNKNYNLNKTTVVLCICLWRMIDAVEDVFWGMYQQKNRLDLATKCYTCRMLFSAILFCLFACFMHSLLVIAGGVLVFSMIISIYLLVVSVRKFKIKFKVSRAAIKRIFKECFPLWIATSLTIYIGNAPKYMIDQYMDEQGQAYFGYLMMPVMVIILISNCVYQPFVRYLADIWMSGKVRLLLRRLIEQCVFIMIITVLMILAGGRVGLSVLSWIYQAKLGRYLMEFIILFIGGGLYAIASFISILLTVIRCQKEIATGSIIVTMLSMIFGKWFIVNGAMLGASLLYLMINLTLSLFLIICFIRKIQKF